MGRSITFKIIMIYKYCISYRDDESCNFDKIIRIYDTLESARNYVIQLYKNRIIDTLRGAVDGIDESIIGVYNDIMNIDDTNDDIFQSDDYDESGFVKQDIFNDYVNTILRAFGFEKLTIEYLFQCDEWERIFDVYMKHVILNFIDMNIQEKINVDTKKNNGQIPELTLCFCSGKFSVVKVEYDSS